MNKTKVTHFLLPAFCAICMLTTVVLGYRIIVLGSIASQKQASLERVETFLKSDKAEAFTNEEALEKFGKEEDSKEVKKKKTVATYQAPEGFLIKSYSKAWDEPKLKLLREELLKNKHGKEINALSEIRIYPNSNAFYLASHSTDEKTTVFKVDFPAVPQFFEIDFLRQVGTICLYGGEENTTPESMAKSLSHEYGHHFTFYHMFEGDDLADSKYAKLRNVPKDKVQTSSTPKAKNYLQKHHWYLFEIAAEDYVTLMGSPSCKRICMAKDYKQMLNGEAGPSTGEINQCANVLPQENLLIPLATEVTGLEEYFYSFVEDDVPPAPKQERKEINIKVQKGSDTYDTAGGKKTFTHYNITWNMPYNDPNAVYTLIRFGEYQKEYYVIPVKSVRAGTTASAYVGDVTKVSGNSIQYFEDILTTGTQYFIVSVQLSDGTIYLSDPLSYKFS